LKTDNTDTSTRSQNLIDVISESANEILPEKQKLVHTATKFNDDEPLNELLNTRSNEHKGSDVHKLLTKKIKKRVRYLRNKRLHREAEQINGHATRRETEELFRLMKNNDSSFKSMRNTKRCEPEKLKEHFSEHFNVAPPVETPRELLEVPNFIKDLQEAHSSNLDHNPPTTNEIRKTLISLKNGKASTDVPPEFLKYSVNSVEMLNEIHKIFCDIWETCDIPTNWTHSKLVCLWKGASKGSPADPKTYRGLQIGTVMCKILIVTILSRLKNWYDQTLLDQQQGFRSGRGTSDGIFVTKRVQQITDKMKKPVYVLFVDLSAAFDHIVRSWLFKSIEQRFIPNSDNTLFRILEAVYSHTTTALSETPNDIFELTTGVRQGGPESPPLYNLFMDYVMRVFERECAQANIQFVKLKYRIRPTACTRDQRMFGYRGDHSADWSGYADDIELFLENINDLEKALKILHSLFNRFGLHINIKKTKTMIFNFKYVEKEFNSSYPESIVSLEDMPIENVKIFRYLGDEVKFDEPSTGDAEIDLRINIAQGKFYELIKKLTNFKIHLSTRVMIFNSLVTNLLVPNLEFIRGSNAKDKFCICFNATETREKWMQT